MFAYPYGSGATPMMGVRDARRSPRVRRLGAEATCWSPTTRTATGGMVMHLNDIYVFRPVFVDGELLCFAWAFIHCTDVGGYAPGSIDMQNSEVFQEGLRLRPVKLFRARRAQRRGLEHLRRQLPHSVAELGRHDRLRRGADQGRAAPAAPGRSAMAARDVAGAMDATLDRTERIDPRRAARESRPASTASPSISRTTTSATCRCASRSKLTARGDGTVELDFTGSDPQVRAALNLPTGDRCGIIRSCACRLDQLRRHQVGGDPHQRRHPALHRSGAARGVGRQRAVSRRPAACASPPRCGSTTWCSAR